jgi:hypothetical protein
MMLSSLDEDVLVGDILKATFVFTKGEWYYGRAYRC